MANTGIQRIIVSVVGVVLIFSLFALPMRLINDTAEKSPALLKEKAENLHEESHQAVQDSSLSTRVVTLREKLNTNVDNPEKFTIFADSLATAYQESMQFDSALYYREQAFRKKNTISNAEKLAETGYQAYVFLSGQQRGLEYGLKARGLFENLSEELPDNVHYKVRIASLYVGTEQPPMKGIGMLKDIIAKYPQDTEARIALGEFMMTVQKFEKAVEQFEAVLTIDPINLKALVYLVDCELYLGHKQKAKEHLQKIKALKGDDPYLDQLVQMREKELNH